MATVNRFAWMPFLAICALSGPLFAQPSARIYEKKLSIPTYGLDKPDPNPRFYIDRTYQGAQGRVYPYPMSDVLTNKRNNKSYDAVYLENDYIKICVLPQIGGRIFSAIDKTNDYDFFYRQSVIKPSLIGMLGSWISGGVEWNFPHHHRSRTYMPMEYEIKENPDGSKTLWMGELERRHRMRLLLGLTVYPDKSYIELTVKIFNRTPVVNSFLYFANPAVHVDETYQVIFPPSTQFVTQHAKKEFAQWPIAITRYGGKRYDNVDISWWKNLTKPVSFFAWNYEDDFFAGYDHGKEAGVAYVANHHIAPGKKFFTFGCGEEGTMWDRMLTDKDGPYLELMAGAYSDNQPDYSWAQPYEVKIIKQYWFPIRQMEDVKYANLNGAVNLEVTDDKTAKIRINTTELQNSARVVLKGKDKTFFSSSASISPSEPFTKDISLPNEAIESDLAVILYSQNGKELLRYQLHPLPEMEMPDPVKPPALPKDIKTNEELYLTGLRLDEFHNPKLNPYDYFEEALRRDPGDVRVNTHLGILYCKRGMFAQAEKKLNTAIERATKNYTSPKDGEAFYYLGVALKAQHKYAPAYDAFYKATWSMAWHSAAYFTLAQIDCIRGDHPKALEHLDISLTTNSLNTRALNLKSAVLRKTRRFEEALAQSTRVMAIDCLDPFAMNELHLTQSAMGLNSQAKKQLDELNENTSHDIQLLIELAVDYSNAGMWDEAIAVLSRRLESESKDTIQSPMVNYYLGFFYQSIAQPEKARKYYSLAAQMPSNYCFPFRTESIEVLRQAFQSNANDYLALYYLGNLLYDLQPENAIAQWEKSRQLDNTFHLVHRNLGFAYVRVRNDLQAAIKSMEKAVECNNKDARLFYELDRLYETANTDPAKRLAMLDNNSTTTAKRDDSLTQHVKLQVRAGQYDKAIKTLTTHQFNKWEGGGRIHDVYVDAFLLRGKQKLDERKYARAMGDFNAALEYPENLEVGKPEFDEKVLRIWYVIAIAAEKLSDTEKAMQYCQKIIEHKTGTPELRYFQALAYLKLDNHDKAAEIFQDLIKTGNDRLLGGTSEDFFAKFGEKQSHNNRLADAHYIIALGCLGTNQVENAKTNLTKALELNINHLWANVMLADLN